MITCLIAGAIVYLLVGIYGATKHPLPCAEIMPVAAFIFSTCFYAIIATAQNIEERTKN